MYHWCEAATTHEVPWKLHRARVRIVVLALATAEHYLLGNASGYGRSRHVRFGPAGTVSPVKHRGYGCAGIPPRGIRTEISSDFDDSLGRCTQFLSTSSWPANRPSYARLISGSRHPIMWCLVGFCRHIPYAIDRTTRIMGYNVSRSAGGNGRACRIPPELRNLRPIRQPSEIDVLNFCGYLRN